MVITDSMRTHTDMVVIRGCLVDELGSYNRAAVWARIEFRANKHNRDAVFEDGHWWWRATLADMSEDVRIKPTALKAHLAALVDGGYVECVKHNGGNGYDHTKSYRPIVFPDKSFGRIPTNPDESDSDQSSLLFYEEKKPEPEKDSDQEFEDWYQAYPRKDAKGQARKAFKAALKKTDLGTLARGRDLYVAQIKAEGTERRYIKLPSTWLNGECWDDDYGDVTLPGFEAWWAKVVSSADVGEVSRRLGLMWQAPDVPDGVVPREFLAASRASWLVEVEPVARSRWVTQFGDVLSGP